MTVGELIERLVEIPLHYKIWIEGCDCWGEAFDVERIDDDSYHPNTVWIGRNLDD